MGRQRGLRRGGEGGQEESVALCALQHTVRAPLSLSPPLSLSLFLRCPSLSAMSASAAGKAVARGILSSSASDAKLRVLGLYRAWYRQVSRCGP